jgi:hypothetical protein
LKKLIFVLLSTLLLLTPTKYANADSYFKYGISILENQPKRNWTDVKLFELGTQEQLFSIIDHQVAIGGWADSIGSGRRSSAFIQYSPGISITQDWYYIRAFWGVLAHTSPDSRLGGNFMFVHDFGLGLKDRRGVSIGFCYKHVSSGGIFFPNYGRDFGTLQLQIPI